MGYEWAVPTFEITTASAQDIAMLGDWAHDEGWNPGLADDQAFFATDPASPLTP